MSLEKKVNQELSQWVSGNGPERDVVLSSRIRLARNIQDVPYPNYADEEDLKKITSLVKEAVSGLDKIKLYYINMAELPEIEKQLLVEKNLTSPVHTEDGVEKGLFINDSENVSMMVNEEDHLRMQVLLPGLQLDKAWKKADKFDDFLEKKLDFAFSKKWGYLSACPTNLGTGLRASVMVHLPALNVTDNINKMLEAVSQLGLVVRGIYGEGSQSAGNIYQISNQITLGNSEADIIDNLKSVTMQIIEKERQTRKRLVHRQEVEVMDRIKRSYGVLKYAHKISSEEAMELLSYVRLGIDMGIINDVKFNILNELLVLIRPAHLQKSEGREFAAEERDVKRAELIQTKLNM